MCDLSSLKRLFRDTVPYDFLLKFEQARLMCQWEKARCPSPPPHILKERLVRQVARRYELRILLETGTYRGDMLYYTRNVFEKLYSIELCEEWYNRATRRLSRYSHIQIVQGDSAVCLAELVGRLDSPVLFWLDGHFSGPGTARSDKDTPIVEELRTLATRQQPADAILIDDMHEFNGQNDYPTIGSLAATVEKLFPSHRFEYADNIGRLLPRI